MVFLITSKSFYHFLIRYVLTADISISLWQVDVPVYSEGTEVKPSEIAKHGLEEAKKKSTDVVIVDTAGRLQVLLYIFLFICLLATWSLIVQLIFYL